MSMIRVDKVTRFVRNHVVHQTQGGQHDAPVEEQSPPAIAVPPALCLLTKDHERRVHAEFLRPESRTLRETRRGAASTPFTEGLAHGSCPSAVPPDDHSKALADERGMSR
jgi:hypothetical protein